MVYSTARERVVLFGGMIPTGFGDGTWESSGAGWRMVGAPGPAQRARHAMAYDSLRHRVVLFGGINLGGVRNDTWEYY